MNVVTAPIAIFSYKRLTSLQRCIESLLKCTLAADTELYIFSDGPKNADDGLLVGRVRDYLVQVKGFKSITFSFSETNKGLAASIIKGVSGILKIYDKLIVLEDDLVLTPDFLVFMNAGLNKYAGQQNAFSISGYSFNLKLPRDCFEDAYFLNRGWSWGWATWKDRWDSVDWDVKDYATFIGDREQIKAFNKGGSDLAGMLQKQMSGKLDSWAIRWFYHQFKISGLTLYPVYSRVLNIGFDEMATHTTGSARRYLPRIEEGIKDEFILPKTAKINSDFQNAFQHKMGLHSRLKSKLASIVISGLRHFKKVK